MHGNNSRCPATLYFAPGGIRSDLSAGDLQWILDRYKKLVEKETKKPFPQDAREQLSMSRDAVFRSWWNQIGFERRRSSMDPRSIQEAGREGNQEAVSARCTGTTLDVPRRCISLLVESDRI